MIAPHSTATSSGSREAARPFVADRSALPTTLGLGAREIARVVLLSLLGSIGLATGCRGFGADARSLAPPPTPNPATSQTRRLLGLAERPLDAAAVEAATPPRLSRALPAIVPVSLAAATPEMRAQDGGGRWQPTGPNGLPRGPMPASGTPGTPAGGNMAPAGTYAPGGSAPVTGTPAPNDGTRVAQQVEPGYPSLQPPGEWSGAPRGGIPYSPFAQDRGFTQPVDAMNLPQNFADLDAILQEGQTGRFMIGAGINSDAGVTGQVIYDEKNFDIRAVPRSWRDIIDGYAFRGAGQSFRAEAYPGNQVQRYSVSFADPYFRGTPISFGLSGYFFDRNYFDWQEQRLGGRVSFGYRLTPDISITTALRAEKINIHSPRVGTSPSLNEVLGDNDLFTGQVSLTHDTRDNPFAATEGYYLELSFQQAFGSYDFPRGDLTYNRYFLMRERPDGSGRHTLMLSTGVGVSGSDTPIFENYFAGGFSTLRGFDFRGASPMEGGVRAGGEFRWINTVEYMFPLTADDMIRGVVFCDFGTVEEKVGVDWADFRVAPGFGFRVSIPRMGMGAPLAFDFAFPVAEEDGDDTRIFSFFMGFQR